MSHEITPQRSVRGAPLRPAGNGGMLQSGNPGNRGAGGKGSPSYWLNIFLAENDGKDAKAVARAMIERAKLGDPVATRIVLDRSDGPVREHVAHDGKVTFEVVHVYEGNNAEAEDEIQDLVEESANG